MHKLILISVTLILFVCAVYPSTAIALGHVYLGTHSTGDIKQHCSDAGGTYVNSEGIYGCWGPGGDVTCSKKSKSCYGTCENCSQRIGDTKNIIPAVLRSPWAFYQWRPSRAPGRINPFKSFGP